MTERFARLKRLWSTLGAKSPVPHRPRLSSSILAALLAIGVVLGFVATRSTHSTNGSFASTTTTTAPTTVPIVPTTLPTTSPPTTTTTAAVASGPVPCTPDEVQVSVSTDTTRYPPGAPVTVTTAVTDVAPCVFTPEAAADVSCPAFLTVTNSAGNQVWPRPGQTEDCSPPAGAVLSPGQQEIVRVVWNQQVSGPSGAAVQAAPGEYQSFATWSWSAGDGHRPYEEQVNSTFALS